MKNNLQRFHTCTAHVHQLHVSNSSQRSTTIHALETAHFNPIMHRVPCCIPLSSGLAAPSVTSPVARTGSDYLNEACLNEAPGQPVSTSAKKKKEKKRWLSLQACGGDLAEAQDSHDLYQGWETQKYTCATWNKTCVITKLLWIEAIFFWGRRANSSTTGASESNHGIKWSSLL